MANVNNRGTSMVLGEKQQVLYGKGYIEDILCGKRFRISPKSFYQVNSVQTEILYAKAVEYFTLAAEQGEPAGMFCLGECFYEGQGREKDPDKAAEWYRKALDAGFEPDEEEQAHLKEVLGDEYQPK